MSSNLLLTFFGDDFTGSTDAMESLAKAGVKTILFASPPDAATLAKYPDLQAYGIAGQTRSMSPADMEKHLRPAFAAMRASGAKFAHYKVCSTFDSSPTIGNIGRVIEVGREAFGVKTVPIVVGAPDLGRYCIFGTLFARYGTDPHPHRIDRHPSMSLHPVTPMDEADLIKHLARQTSERIELFDIVQLERRDAPDLYRSLLAESPAGVLIDTLNASHLPIVGRLLHDTGLPFIVGSSGVESAFTTYWKAQGLNAGSHRFPEVEDVGPIIAVCGSMSPNTASQIHHAAANGFVVISIDWSKSIDPASISAIKAAADANRAVVIHSGERQPSLTAIQRADIGRRLGDTLLKVLEATRIKRVIIAGGDTSGEIARVLKIESIEMIGELTRGAPLCTVRAPGSPADGLQMVFKGGQIGAADFFSFVRHGKTAGAS